MSNLEDIQDLLDRATKFRQKLQPSPELNKEEYFTNNFELNFIDGGREVEIITPSNIQERYTITKDEAITGCTKTLTYTKLNRFHKEIETNIQFNIPSGIKNGQDIVLEGKGNYMKDRYSNLIIKIIIR